MVDGDGGVAAGECAQPTTANTKARGGSAKRERLQIKLRAQRASAKRERLQIDERAKRVLMALIGNQLSKR